MALNTDTLEIGKDYYVEWLDSAVMNGDIPESETTKIKLNSIAYACVLGRLLRVTENSITIGTASKCLLNGETRYLCIVNVPICSINCMYIVEQGKPVK